jgi:hypothetical protein
MFVDCPDPNRVISEGCYQLAQSGASGGKDTHVKSHYLKITAVALGISISASLGMVLPTFAAEPDAPPESGYVQQLVAQLSGATAAELASLSKSDVALLTKYGQVADVATRTTIAPTTDSSSARSGASPQAVGCWVATTYYTGTNVLGNTLYQSWNTGRWCSSGASISVVSVAGQGAQTYWPGWSTSGLVQSQQGIVSNQGRSFSQHSFQFQLGTPWPTQFTQPCTRVKGTTAGTNPGDNVCSLY